MDKLSMLGKELLLEFHNESIMENRKKWALATISLLPLLVLKMYSITMVASITVFLLYLEMNIQGHRVTKFVMEYDEYDLEPCIDKTNHYSLWSKLVYVMLIVLIYITHFVLYIVGRQSGWEITW